MAHYPYIILRSSDGQRGGQFRVLVEGYKPTLQKNATVNKTVGGKLDVSQGGIYEIHDYVIRVRHTEDVEGYANKAELEYLYRLNNPKGSPSDVITFTDHYGRTMSCYMLGDFTTQTLGCEIEGTTAWFLVQVTLQVIPA